MLKTGNRRQPVHETVVLGGQLSQREIDVLRLLAAGHSNQEIAEQLLIAENTVKSHLKHLYGKLDVHNRVQAVVQAQALRLLNEPTSII